MEWNVSISSNGSVFKEEIKELLQKGKANLNVSIDAGTRKTYQKIKGHDFLDKVVTNLKNYSESDGDVSLKYIILDGINDNKEDIDGFINIAKMVAKYIIISSDTYQIKNSMSDRKFDMLTYLMQECKRRHVQFYIDMDRFNICDVYKIKSMQTALNKR